MVYHYISSGPAPGVFWNVAASPIPLNIFFAVRMYSCIGHLIFFCIYIYAYQGQYIVATELKDHICHSDECQIGSFSSEATICALVKNISSAVGFELGFLHPYRGRLSCFRTKE